MKGFQCEIIQFWRVFFTRVFLENRSIIVIDFFLQRDFPMKRGFFGENTFQRDFFFGERFWVPKIFDREADLSDCRLF